ncbi:MAG: LmeA family phospholipid-binding protein [Actinomycetes bacterium]
MKTKIIVAASATASLILGGLLGVQQYISSQITSGVEREMPKASGISVSIPFADVLGNITSDSIKSVHINIESFALKENGIKTSLDISASNIGKAKPNLVESLEVTATIPASTITESSEFDNAQIVGNTLQVSTGADGLGTASLIPKHSDNQIYFELQIVSILGNEIPASSLPADLQNQIKSKSQVSLTLPNGLKIDSVSLSNKGLSVKMSGSHIQLGDLGSSL